MKKRAATFGECWRFCRIRGLGWFSAGVLATLLVMKNAQIEELA